MIYTYASFRQQTPDDIFDIAAIAGSAANIERNFYAQFANRAGRNHLTAAKSITSTGVRVTINDNILPDEEVFWVIISYETTGNAVDSGIIAQYQVRESNQTTKRSLPATIDFTTDEHFIVNRAVATFDDLPTDPLIAGSLALVADTSIYYRYDPEATTDADSNLFSYGALAKGAGNWIEYYGTFNAYVSSTVDAEGSDRALFTIENALRIPPKIGDTDSIDERYWFNNGLTNDGGSPVENTKFTLEVSVNDVPNYESIFADKFVFYLRGYLNRDTMVLDTSITGVNNPQVWNPTDGIIQLPEQLDRNHAAVYDIRASFNTDEILGLIPNRPDISLNVVEVLNIQAKVSEIGKVLGDIIFQDYDQFRIVPGIRRLGGKASFEAGFIVEDVNEQIISGLTDDTADQQVIMAGNLNGYTSVKAPGEALEYSEVLRAIASTEPGVSHWRRTNPITLNNEAITVTVTHPVNPDGTGNIRNDYGDSSIAGYDKAVFTPVNAYVHLEIDTTTIYLAPVQNVAPLQTQDFTFTDLSSFTVETAIPDNTDANYSLFEPEDISVAIAGSGGFTGSVRVYVQYAYITPNGIATRINNQATGAFPILNTSLAEAVNGSLLKSQNLTDVPDKPLALSNLGGTPFVDFEAHRLAPNPHQINPAKVGSPTLAVFNTLDAQVQALGTASTKNTGTNNDQIPLLQNAGDGRGIMPPIPLGIEIQTADFTATPNILTGVDTTAGIVNATLPTTANGGDVFWFYDVKGSDSSSPTGFGNNKLVVQPGTNKIQGYAEDLDVDTENSVVKLVFDGVDNFNIIGGIV